MLHNSKKVEAVELLTIGYEGSSIDDFVATLKATGVTTLIDVRELPLSRKKGFSKNSLKQAMESADITYLHLRSLGDPKPGRDAARAGDLDGFREIFSRHLQSSVAQEGLEQAALVVSAGGACLLCFERCHTTCHRSIVANELVKRAKVKLRHIGVKNGLAGRNGA